MVIEKTRELYKNWQKYLRHFPKVNRYTLGAKIDTLLIEAFEYMALAQYTQGKLKIPLINKALTRTDLIKIFLQIAWELQALDNTKYGILSEQLDEVGRMLVGWKKQVERKTPHH